LQQIVNLPRGGTSRRIANAPDLHVRTQPYGRQTGAGGRDHDRGNEPFDLIEAASVCARKEVLDQQIEPEDDMELGGKIARAKDLIAKREEIDAELAQLLGGAMKHRKQQACSVCGEAGHSARTCPQATKEPAT